MCDNIQLRARESASNFHRVLQRTWLHVKVYGICLWQDYNMMRVNSKMIK